MAKLVKLENIVTLNDHSNPQDVRDIVHIIDMRDIVAYVSKKYIGFLANPETDGRIANDIQTLKDSLIGQGYTIFDIDIVLNQVRDIYQVQADNRVKSTTKTLRHNIRQLQKKLNSVEDDYKRLYERKLKESLSELTKENEELKKKLDSIKKTLKS